jgi:hypothetical protein
VLPCSRLTSRAVGPLAWVVLEELALRAQAGEGLAIETNVRALSSDLGVGKDTVAQALSRLAALGLVSSQAQRRAGRYAGSVYELDVEACRHVGLILDGVAADMSTPVPPCPVQPDAVERGAAVSDTAASVRAEPRAAAPASTRAPARPAREPVSQSLFDLSSEAPSQDLLRPTPLSSSANPPFPLPRPALPTATPSSPTRSFQPDALAPGVRRGPGNVARSGASGPAELNGDLDGQVGPPC